MFAPGYFASSYWPSAYFTGGSVSSGVAGGMYFAPAYWPSGYWPSSYFPGVGDSSMIVDTLAEAFRTRMLAGVPTLSDFYRRETPGKTAAGTSPVTPYCIFNVLGESPEWVSGPNLYPGWLDVQLTFVSISDIEAETVRDAAYRLFTPRRNLDGSAANRPIVSADGTVPAFGCLPGRKTEYKNPGKGPLGQPLWLFQFAMRCYVTRAM